MASKALLIILDGYGLGDHKKDDAIFNTPTPYMDKLVAEYPNSQLQASGEDVGLPDGQMGNSEVGHLNIGAGRVVYQDLVNFRLSRIFLLEMVKAPARAPGIPGYNVLNRLSRRKYPERTGRGRPSHGIWNLFYYKRGRAVKSGLRRNTRFLCGKNASAPSAS